MNSVDIKYLITALADGEISDESKRNALLEQLNSDKRLMYDFLVQKRMKALVAGMKFHPAPLKIKQRIIRKIKPVQLFSNEPGNIRLSQAFWVYGTAAIILISIVLILFNRPPLIETTDFTAKNMFNEASSNFQKILTGELKPQLISSDPAVIQSFFKEQGVKYSPVIPIFDDLKLVGAVVSDERGEKLAHHVYAGENNKLVYVFQADESYINNGDFINLPAGIKETIRKNNCFSSSENRIASVVTIVDHNVFAIVSDLPLEEIEAHFCAKL